MMMVTRGCVGHPTVKVFLVVVQLQVSQAEPRPCGDPNRARTDLVPSWPWHINLVPKCISTSSSTFAHTICICTRKVFTHEFEFGTKMHTNFYCMSLYSMC